MNICPFCLNETSTDINSYIVAHQDNAGFCPGGGQYPLLESTRTIPNAILYAQHLLAVRPQDADQINTRLSKLREIEQLMAHKRYTFNRLTTTVRCDQDDHLWVRALIKQINDERESSTTQLTDAIKQVTDDHSPPPSHMVLTAAMVHPDDKQYLFDIVKMLNHLRRANCMTAHQQVVDELNVKTVVDVVVNRE